MTMNKDEFFSWISGPLREARHTIDGRQIRLREMSEEQRTQYELMLQDKKGKPDIAKARRAMIAMMLIDEEGNRIVDDESQLKAMPGGLAGLIYEKCLELSRYQAGEVEELIKNSETADG